MYLPTVLTTILTVLAATAAAKKDRDRSGYGRGMWACSLAGDGDASYAAECERHMANARQGTPGASVPCSDCMLACFHKGENGDDKFFCERCLDEGC